MGQTLSEPVTAKETASCANSIVKVGSSCMQGWRINMEDAHTHLLSVPEVKDAAFFAVYDGHGGAKIAHYAGNHLHKRIIQTEAFSKGRIEDAIRDGFLQLDADMAEDHELKDELAGTTAVICLMKDGKIFCGNVGDSRAVVSVGGLAEPLSYDHKPANESEARRIVAAGGWVEFNRVNGNLALSRALGDFIFKRNDEKPPEEQIVTAFPDVIVRDLTPDMEFFVLACDGIWDVLSNQDVVDFCRDRLAAKMEPETICEELLTRCLAPDCQMGGLGCDNMTVVLVCLLRGQSWEEFCAKCTRPRPPTPPPEESPPPLFSTPPATPSATAISSHPVEIPTYDHHAPAKENTEMREKEHSEEGSAPMPQQGDQQQEDGSPPQKVPDLSRDASTPPVGAHTEGDVSVGSDRSPAAKQVKTDQLEEDAPPAEFTPEGSPPVGDTSASASNKKTSADSSNVATI